MALTQQQFQQLKEHWPLVIKTIYADIDEIPDGGGDTIAEKLATWRSRTYAKPSEAVVEAALVDTVIPAVEAEQTEQTEREIGKSEALTRLKNSPLANRTPDEIYTVMQNQIDGWQSLADAKQDLRSWLPLLAVAVMYLNRRD